MAKIIDKPRIIDPDAQCREIIHDSGWRCNDQTNAHICQRAASHITNMEGDSRLHKCSLCNYMWPSEGSDVGKPKLKDRIITLKMCDECKKPCRADDFMGIKVWVCDECQEVYDMDESKDYRRRKKEDMDATHRLCIIGQTIRKHEVGDSKCSYSYCKDHCREYHSHMVNHEQDTSALAMREEEKKPLIPDPQPLKEIETFFRPSDIDWR